MVMIFGMLEDDLSVIYEHSENKKYGNVSAIFWQCYGNVCFIDFKGTEMKINELYSDILIENTKYEFKAILNQDNPVK